MIKVLFSDVDQTILNHEHQIPDPVVRSLKRFGEQRRVILATARSPQGIRWICEILGIEHAICFNGAWIGNPVQQTCLWETSLDRSLALSIVKAAHEAGVPCLWYGSDATYTLERTELVERESENTREAVVVVQSLDDLPGQPFKVMGLTATPQDGRFDPLRTRFAPDCAVTSPHWHVLEFTPGSVSKGKAAAQLAELLGVPATACAAAGDGENDISLLTWAGLPVTVANAIPECIGMAKYVGLSADEAGMADVVDWIERERLIEA
ncbi:HAD family hydrolase [Dyella telluris]|uniref:HAD family hydrolase n=1 Tax=Dyella telluris TaxID=2763498 RepID=A0A7G8Q3T0_9GAMM|nr:HAD family hydrolase [Dyella telluris]QNK01438.1 HAD family hydrolase [Dyella telluris]